jgi:type II secretory pathway pseudopilin PulG
MQLKTMKQKKRQQRERVIRDQSSKKEDLGMRFKMHTLGLRNARPKNEKHSSLFALHSRFSTTSGSIMMQVLVSLFILSMGLSGALAVIIASIEANKTNEYRMIATNLAQEGLEAVRSIRDTNWLTYSSNLRECWNYWEDTNEDGVVTPSEFGSCTPNASGQNNHPWNSDLDGSNVLEKYIVDFDDSNFRWKVISEDKFPTINTDPDYTNGFQLFKRDNGSTTFYTHDAYEDTGETVTQSVFSRSISMYYVDADDYDDSVDPIQGGSFPIGEKGKDNRILVVATVSWTQRGREREVVMSTVMTDFFDRHEWES